MDYNDWKRSQSSSDLTNTSNDSILHDQRISNDFEDTDDKEDASNIQTRSQESKGKGNNKEILDV